MVVAVMSGHLTNHEGKVRDWLGGGYEGTLRAYRAYHPAARIFEVTYRGRTVWMSGKQFAIWNATQWWLKHHRFERTTLEVIAKRAHCSKATASRFLRRLDLWRFLDYAALIGRKGGTWLKRRRGAPYVEEREAWLAGARVTWKSRKIARDRMAARIRQRLQEEHNDRIAALMRKAQESRIAFARFMRVWRDDTLGGGITDATFMPIGG